MRTSFKHICLLTLVLSSPFAYACLQGIELKVDSVTLAAPVLNSTTGPTAITFQQTYLAVPLVFILPGNNNTDPATVRVKNITTTGFEVGVAESEGEDGDTLIESFTYLAISPGNSTLGGKQIQAGSINTNAYYRKSDGGSSYATITYPTPFPASPSPVVPIVVHDVQSFNNDSSYDFDGGFITLPTLETIGLQATATNTSFGVALMRAETFTPVAPLANETIAYLALEPGTGSFLDGGTTINFNAFETADNISDACTNAAHGLSGSPIALANMARLDGGDGGWIRQCSIDGTNISLKVQEDRATDTDLAHTTESASVIAFSQDFTVNLIGSGGPQMEIVTTNANQQISPAQDTLVFTTVTFARPFADVPLIFSLPSEGGINEPASLRVRNRTVNGFEIAQVQPDGEFASADAMTIDYIAVVPSTHLLTDTISNSNRVVEAGVLNTSAFQGSQVTGDTLDTLTFTNTFGTVPALILDVQTTNSEPGLDPSSPSSPWLEGVIEESTITTTDAQVTMDRGETNGGTVIEEVLGYLASDSGLSISFNANNNANVYTNITMKTLLTLRNIAGADNGCFTNNYPSGAFASTPLAVATMASSFGGDGGWIRRCSNSPSSLGLTVDEDRANDTERSHTTEQAAFFAFSEPFEWCSPKIEVQKNSIAIRDPVNNDTFAKAIPDALVRYSLKIENQSMHTISNGSVVITDEVPANTSLFIESTAIYPEAPFIFDLGTGVTVSGLGFVYGGATDAGDSVEFSENNGADLFAYTPTSVGGFDANITDIRITLSGEFNRMINSTDIPTVTIGFAVKID